MGEKKVFISIRSNEPISPIKMALEKVSSLTHQVVENPEDANLIVVNSSADALTMLKENDEATVVIAMMPGMRHEETGTRSLKRAYPERVVVAQMFNIKPDSGDVLLVPYIMGLASEKKEEV